MKKSTSAGLPVSKKFYKSIIERIMASAAAFGDASLAESATAVVSAYIIDGVMPTDEIRAEVKLVFTLLKTEIDKAIRRSAAARARRCRCVEVAVDVARQQPVASATVENPEEVSAYELMQEQIMCKPLPHEALAPKERFMNRSERREAERKARRAGKMKVKSLGAQRH
ncbi:MAG: hypothetical protein NC212_00015 [Staphylococcus sp.]|nr:hypothetical protein [Staphylococcus sp.]